MNKNSFLNKINNQRGQALLVVVLVMVVALTVGLSIASKSITGFRNSTEQASSQKALSAAEAGIEQALKSNVSIGTPDNPIKLGDSNYNTTVTQVDGTEFLLNGGNPVLQSSGIDLWLTAYNKESTELYKDPYQGPFTVYWGDSTGACNNAALEVVVITGTRASPVISRYAFDPCDIGNEPTRQDSNHFAACLSDRSQGCKVAIHTIANKTFQYQATIPAVSGLVARVIPLYMNAILGVSGQLFPSQGKVITSIGKSGATERKVNVFQGYPELPAEYYLYNLFVPK